MTQTTDRPPQNSLYKTPKPVHFTEIGVSGFKSFAEETRIQLGSLTILAGTNSSGKSSIMQPLLLMKQTIEADYDPGALLLDGPNVSFTSGEQIMNKTSKASTSSSIGVRLVFCNYLDVTVDFSWNPQNGIEILRQTWKYQSNQTPFSIEPEMSSSEIYQMLPNEGFMDDVSVERHRCFLVVTEAPDQYGGQMSHTFSQHLLTRFVRNLIHIRGLRGNPERTYKTAAVSGSAFFGRFEDYVANIIDRFQKENPEQLIKIHEALQKLGLTDIVQTQRLNDTQIELRVGRVFGQADPTDTVNIADVGLGVSQVLPVIVALLVAQPGQLVYIEQPEIHLHPRAQIALSEIFADAANRGVRVVVETHSELFLLGVQSLVAEDKLDPKEVKLHWFTRNPDGSSKVTSAELDTTGAFGDWPQDFGMTALALENRYLSAAEAKLWNAGNGRSHN
jgi:predicted ATPase